MSLRWAHIHFVGFVMSRLISLSVFNDDSKNLFTGLFFKIISQILLTSKSNIIKCVDRKYSNLK